MTFEGEVVEKYMVKVGLHINSVLTEVKQQNILQQEKFQNCFPEVLGAGQSTV